MLESPNTGSGTRLDPAHSSAIHGKHHSFRPLLSILLLTLVGIGLKLTPSVISASPIVDFRCSHVPPVQEQVHHVWLDNINFTAASADQQSSDNPIGTIELETNGQSIPIPVSRTRRHSKLHHGNAISDIDQDVGPILKLESPDSDSFQDSLWNLLRRLEKPISQLTSTLGTVTSDQIYDELVPMKIQVYYDPSVHALEAQKFKSIQESVMPTVVKFFEEVLLIRREYTIDKFRISRRCPNNTIYYAKDVVGLSRPYCMDRCEDHAVCGEMIVPREHLSACSYCNLTSRRCTTNYASEGKGVANTQLLLYVSAKQTVRCKKDQTIAYAAHCAQDTKTDRPVAGHANLCPASISTDPKDLKALIATVKHELTHVLGFSVSLFAYYRNQDGQPLTERGSTPGPIPVDPRTGYARWSDKVIRKVTRSDWITGEGPVDKEIHLVVTPTVVREVRRHFNCSTLEGAELEDQGSDGTSMTHWEKRLFENEAMTGTHTQNSVYSRITLAVLQDTGWYVANFTSAEKLDWGRDLGCDFAKKSCKSWIDERRAKRASIRPYCDRVKGDLLQIACTEDRSSKAVCNMRYYKEPLPRVYQNFDHLEDTVPADLAHYGGSVDLADYCPFIQEFTWQVQNVTVRGSRCDLGSNSVESEKNAALEHYGPDSKCFEHGRRWEQRSCAYKRHWHHFGAGCYKYTCSNDHLSITVGGNIYPCFYPDQLVHIHQSVDQWLYNGSLVCPSCDKICSPNQCASYDKKLIDKILNLNAVNDTEEVLRSILDENFNDIDTHGTLISSDETYRKYKSVLDETNQLLRRRADHEDSELKRQSQPTWNIFSSPNRKHPMSCSGADKLSWSNAIILVTLLINILPII